MRIGILSYQGAVREHSKMLNQLSVEPVIVKYPEDFSNLDGLIIPGGESTTISDLIHTFGLRKSIKALSSMGTPIWGTCAGAIILSNDPGTEKVRALKLIDIYIERNAYGPQKESFEAQLQIKGIGNFPGIFIRAPIITAWNNGAEIMAEHNKNPVMARSGNILITTFHPELTNNPLIHKFFLGMSQDGQG